MLGSPTLPGRVALRQLAISLPEGTGVPPTGTAELIGAALLERHDDRKFGRRFSDTTRGVATLAHLPVRLVSADLADVEREVIERYPGLANFHVLANRRHSPELRHVVLLLDPPGVQLTLSTRSSMPAAPSEA